MKRKGERCIKEKKLVYEGVRGEEYVEGGERCMKRRGERCTKDRGRCLKRRREDV
jgi:hypothetical protein